ncbi:endonuclease/exonuclease/phosphatase family protein [Catenisphaera adipataccumulans]|uniref:Endonuclease/exonuclease/phosphatase family metal-dependent hydrolase n=1 Tax=Catenisphaera adipataccumulans TaxID=700500 RepID=A0A7W8FXJ9_9FIRM|nr:endonuclease/exonuclease/phosphatase family protein [Catenisphaera adipataccumulans]MBB5183022.1 endonuclease/exonuclease/phosphatase family metal-dependent hydrolase [Catenisphaera adipataccumulans]
MKKLKIIGVIVLTIVCIVAVYVVYVFASYYRVEDNQKLKIHDPGKSETKAGKTYRITSANIGFGAYSADYSFFMDGGKYSRAFSKTAVIKNINGSVKEVHAMEADFEMYQEVDIDGTRSYHVNELDLIKEKSEGSSYVYAQNYDSPYLFYPLTSPHGKNKAGIATFSKFKSTSAVRRSLPIETGFSKFFDLDRCYIKQRFPVDNGKELIVYNFHLSAYTKEADTADKQLKMLFGDMEKEVKKGNYVVGGGDFNKDLLGDSYSVFKQGEALDDNWAKPVNKKLIPEDIRLEVPYDEDDPVPTCRNANMPYSEDDFVLTIDGFIVSDNVTVKQSFVRDTQFAYSDHNPVGMDFILE